MPPLGNRVCGGTRLHTVVVSNGFEFLGSAVLVLAGLSPAPATSGSVGKRVDSSFLSIDWSKRTFAGVLLGLYHLPSHLGAASARNHSPSNPGFQSLPEMGTNGLRVPVSCYPAEGHQLLLGYRQPGFPWCPSQLSPGGGGCDMMVRNQWIQGFPSARSSPQQLISQRPPQK